MKLWKRLFTRSASVSNPAMAWMFGAGEPSKSGVTVNSTTAMQASVVAACVRLISEGVGRMPLHVVTDTADAFTPVTDHWAHRLLAQQPTVDLHSMEWREFMTASALLTGNAVALKVRKSARKDEYTELLPLLPGWYSITKAQTRSGRSTYTVATPFGVSGTFGPDDVFHLRGPLLKDDALGSDFVRLGAESIGLSLAMEASHATLHANGVRPSGVLTTEQSLSQEAITSLSEQFQGNFAGILNSGKVPLLDKGLKFAQATWSGVDSQHLETRKFQVEEVCRIFNCFPQMVMHNTATTTYASVEAFFAAHLEHTLMPWVIRWQSALQRDVIGYGKGLRIELDTKGFRAPNLNDLSAHVDRMVNRGVMTKNDGRRAIGLQPIDGLDDKPEAAPIGHNGGPPIDGAPANQTPALTVVK